MGMVKKATQYIPIQHSQYRLAGKHPDWEMHPSWIAGIEALDAYNHWVSEVVMPIAFQWIEEHKAEVYATVADENKDDVGVVIAAAFQRIKELPSYVNGLVRSQHYEHEIKHDTWDTQKINPVWTGIVEDVRTKTKKEFDAREDVLLDTIR